MDMETLLVIFLFYIFVVHASAFRQVENGLAPRSPITTAPPKLDNRDISSICGFYYDSVITTAIITKECDGAPCVVDQYVTPNLVFCSKEALVPYTKYYSYGGWPQSGCGIGETCCRDDSPYAITFSYDNGASYYYTCDYEYDYYTQPVTIYTQLQEFSISISPYMTIDVATSTSTSKATQGVAFIPGVASTSSSNNTNPKIALAAGLGAGIPIVLVASISTAIFLIRRSKQVATQRAFPRNELAGSPIDPRPRQTPAIYELCARSVNADRRDPSQHLAELDGG